MRVEELSVGSWVKYRYHTKDEQGNKVREVVKHFQVTEIEKRLGYYYVWSKDGRMCRPEDLVPIRISGHILQDNGWVYSNGIWVKKGLVRLGWYEKEKTLIIGYTTFPIVVEHIHTMQMIQRLLGTEELTL